MKIQLIEVYLSLSRIIDLMKIKSIFLGSNGGFSIENLYETHHKNIFSAFQLVRKSHPSKTNYFIHREKLKTSTIKTSVHVYVQKVNYWTDISATPRSIRVAKTMFQILSHTSISCWSLQFFSKMKKQMKHYKVGKISRIAG